MPPWRRRTSRRARRPSCRSLPRSPTSTTQTSRRRSPEFANPAVSGPVTLVFGKSPVRLSPRQFAPVLDMRAEGGALVPELDEEKLGDLVESAVSRNGSPVDAGFKVVDGKPKIVPDKPGVSYRPEDVSDAFLDLVRRPSGEREERVKATVAEADFTTQDARALKITERVSTFTTYYPYAEYRNVNIGRAAELVNGTVLKPGDVFSLNDTVGERTRENGFTEGFIISDGIFKEDLGGGVSQMATTTFNAMFFAGLKDVEHKTHSFYIDRYPVGREATVAWGAVDLRFQNDTPYGVLITANVTPSTPSSQGVVTVSMYSTKYWDITTSTSDRYNYTAGADPDPAHPRLLPEQRVRRLRRRRHALLQEGRGQPARPLGEVPHDVHPLRHGHLQAAEERPRLRRRSAQAGADGPCNAVFLAVPRGLQHPGYRN